MQIEALCAFSNPPGLLSESWNIDADRGSNFFELNHPPFTFWTRWLKNTKHNSPVFSYDLHSHTGIVSFLSNTFQLTHAAVDFAVSLLSEAKFHTQIPSISCTVWKKKIASPPSEKFLISIVSKLCDLNTRLWSQKAVNNLEAQRSNRSCWFLFFF